MYSNYYMRPIKQKFKVTPCPIYGKQNMHSIRMYSWLDRLKQSNSITWVVQ